MSAQKYAGRVQFLYEADEKERQKILRMLGIAANIVSNYFGKKSDFDVVIVEDGWSMELQTISRERRRFYDTKYLAVTDLNLREIVIRKDVARLAQYIHELIHSITPREYPHQLREGLAYYFTLEILKSCECQMPRYSAWVDDLYVKPTRSLVKAFGLDVVR